jgi:hypothetical protein
MTRSMGTSCGGRLQEADFCSFYDRNDQDSTLRSEKRRALRFMLEEPVVVETQDGELIGAVVMNYGKNGLYFESDLKTSQGTRLRIRNESTLACPSRGGCFAEVRWSKRLETHKTDYEYGTGVRYC